MNYSNILAAKRYAKAYASLDEDYASLSAAYEAVKNVDSLFNPIVSKAKKEKFIKEVFAADRTVSDFLCVLAEAKRLNLLALIAEETRKIINKKHGVAEVEVISAFPVGAARSEEIKQAAKKYFKCKEVVANFKEDKSLLGGIIMKDGETVVDASISGGLKKLGAILK